MAEPSQAQFEQVERLFHEALALPDADRGAFLARACGDDDALRREVESLLRHTAGATLLDRPLGSGATRAPAHAPPSLTGRRIGAYEVGEQLGRGGMGVVFAGRDLRLGRAVAIKGLPPAFAAHPERLARLVREAKVLASLSHPNIGAIYGMEEDGPTRHLVMELVEGETLLRRLRRGPMDVGECLSVGRQICAALEAAHDAGVIHRDLKPANVMLSPRGEVKVVDFGLARDSDGAAATPGELTEGPMTAEGAVLGTPGYMSPEQARGRAVDRRTDVFAFGCVLYECLAGRPAFPGETAADVTAHVLGRDPDWGALPAATPPAIRRLLERCLAKDPRQRLRDAGDARLEIDEALAARPWEARPLPPPSAVPVLAMSAQSPWLERRGAWVAGVVVAVVIASLVGLIAGLTWGRSHTAARPTAAAATTGSPRPAAGGPSASLASGLQQFDVYVPGAGRGPADVVSLRPAISRSGGRFVFSSPGDGTGGDAGNQSVLWNRARAARSPSAVPLSAGAVAACLTPDGLTVAYFRDGAWYRQPLAGGTPAKLVDADEPWPACWGSDGWFYFTPARGRGIWRVPANGTGGPVGHTLVMRDRGEQTHVAPCQVPSTRALLYTVRLATGATRIAAIAAEGGRTAIVEPAGNHPRLAPSPTGRHLLFERGGTVYAHAFDAERLATVGAEAPIVPGVLTDAALQVPCFDVSEDGTLVYAPGAVTTEPRRLSRAGGRPDPMAARAPAGGTDEEPPRGLLTELRTSTVDRASLVVRGAVGEAFTYDAARRTYERVATGDGDVTTAAISPDGRRLAYGADRGRRYVLCVRSLDDAREHETDVPDYPAHVAWSPDGRWLYFDMATDPLLANGIWRCAVGDAGALEPAERLPSARPREHETEPAPHPDGRRLAYVSTETGAREVFVRPMAAQGGGRGPTVQVSQRGGESPRWSPDGRRLFYRHDGRVFAADLSATDGRPTGDPIDLTGPRDVADFAVTGPDDRLLLLARARPAANAALGAAPRRLQVVLNWHQLLPTGRP